ncbi:MAG: cytochrome c [Rhodobacterales bacterium]|nr:cytochrome c [Rhodobacterales bacterium]
MYRFTIAATLVATLFTAPAALADDSPADTVKYRHIQMETMGKHMYSSKLILKGNVSRAEDLNAHAAALHALGNNLVAQFPANTKPDGKLETEALAAIWTDAKGFEKAVKAYNDATSNYVVVAKTGDLVKALEAYGKVGQSCGGCHDTYREEDE